MHFKNEKEFALLQKQYEYFERKTYHESEKYNTKFQRSIFGLPITENENYVSWISVPTVISTAIKFEAQRIIRDCENTFREEMSLPRIGEGWIAETELFYKLSECFQSEKVLKHARPIWLAPQHLDIYFSDKNIGIEYQGLQHQQPVEYFGGQKALEKQQIRDERKRKLCEENGCQLIYVYEGYNFEELTNNIKSLIEAT